MKIPDSKRKKALIVVDVQPRFVDDKNKYIVENIVKLIKGIGYDIIVETIFHAEKGSLWDKQQHWTSPKGDEFHTVDEIRNATKHLNIIHIEKEKKSVFKGDKDLSALLRGHDIEEVHIVGMETNDCIIASAYESFDLGFFTYIIEECCQSATSDEFHKMGLELLRRQCITNNSCIENVDFIEI